MALKQRFLYLFLFTLISSSAYAELSPVIEVSGASNAFLGVQSTAGTSGNPDQNSTTTSLGFTISYFLANPHWEPFFAFTTNIVAGANSQSNFGPSLGLKYNFAEDVSNSYVLGARIGESFLSNTSSHQYDLFLWAIFVQKRFALTEHIAWTPEISYFSRSSGRTTAGGSTYRMGAYSDYQVTPLQFALLF